MKTVTGSERGSAIIEFTLAGIPMIFLLFSTMQLTIGMWNYFSIDHAVNTAARYAAVHGAGCTANGNTCAVTVGQITTVLASAAGVPAANFNVTLTTDSGAATPCAPVSSCTSSSTAWPPSTNNDNQAGKNITISANYNFSTALAMFWFKDGTVRFAPIRFDATTTQQIIF